MSKVHYHDVSADEAGQRIDNFLLARLKGAPRSLVYKVPRKGEVRVNKGRVKPTYRLVAGDRVRIPPVRLPAEELKPAPSVEACRRVEEAIIYEDNSLLALDKPAGLAVHGGSGISFGLIELLRAARPDAPFLELVHRLDRDTSGCILVAKKRSALRDLHRQLRDGEVEKRYLVLLKGRWELGSKTIDAPLATHHRSGGERTVKVAESGKPARTAFRPVDFFKEATLLEASLETGRTHQIRVHAAWAGHPVAGDPRYGDQEFNAWCKQRGLTRMFLHAHALGFARPNSGEPELVSAPLDPQLARLLDTLASEVASARERSRKVFGARPGKRG